MRRVSRALVGTIEVDGGTSGFYVGQRIRAHGRHGEVEVVGIDRKADLLAVDPSANVGIPALCVGDVLEPVALTHECPAVVHGRALELDAVLAYLGALDEADPNEWMAPRHFAEKLRQKLHCALKVQP